jgi:hypothetical protein
VILSLRRHRGKRIHRRVSALVWALSFVLQVACVPIGIDASSQWLAVHVKEAALPFAFLDFPVKVIQTLLPDLLGFLFGILTRPFPAAIREPGRWILLIPLLLFPAVAIASYFTNLHDILFAVYGVRGSEYEGIGVVGLIFPAAGICLYSLGVRAGDRYSDPLADVFGDEDVVVDEGPGVKGRRLVKPDMPEEAIPGSEPVDGVD